VISATGFTSPTYYVDGIASSTPGLYDAKWHHIVVTGTAAITGSQVELGRANSVYFGGTIDDVRIYNRALSYQQIQQLYAQGKAIIAHSNPTPTTSTLNKGLVGYWTFDGPTVHWGTGKVDDVSGQGNTGTLVGMSTTTSPTIGKIGQALKFSGSNYVQAPSSASLEISTRVSIVVWVRPSSFSGYPTVVSKNGTADDYQLGFDGTTGFIRPCLNGLCSTGTNPVPLNTWSEIGFTYDGSFIRTYLSGQLDSISAHTGSLPTNSSDPLDIGAATLGGFRYTGTIDDVRIYNRALSYQEIQQLYLMDK